MTRNSAFARVIGITKSLSPLSFERNRASDDDHRNEPGYVIPPTDFVNAANAGPVLEARPIVALTADAEAEENAADLAIEDAEADPETGTAVATLTQRGVVTPFPAMAKVTVVAGASEADPSDPEEQDVEVGAALVEAIENDIATVLSTFDAGHDAMPEAPMSDADDEGEASEERTLELLGELNRMWQADPEVVAQSN